MCISKQVGNPSPCTFEIEFVAVNVSEKSCVLVAPNDRESLGGSRMVSAMVTG